MRVVAVGTFTQRNPGYTPPVTARRLLSGAALVSALFAGLTSTDRAHAQAADTNTAEAARTVGQAARGVANAADDAADGTLSVEDQADPTNPLEKARQGVVVLERAGKLLGVGTVLNGDGRILTALSPLTHGNNVDARYPDGSVSRVRIGHSDRGWDLALLIPQNSHWKTGLKPSRETAVTAGLGLQTFSQIGKKNLALSRTIVKGTDTLLGGDSLLLRDAVELASQFKDSEIGTPILDAKGDVVAVVAKACAPNGADGCRPVAYGVPVTAIKAFLRTVPAGAVPPAPWLGIQGTAEDAGPARGVRVLSVHPSSPAAAAGLRGGNDKSTSDTVIAIDGVPVLTPEALAESINSRSVGDSVRVLLFGGGKYREVSLILKSAPDDTAKAPLAPKPASKRSTSTAP